MNSLKRVRSPKMDSPALVIFKMQLVLGHFVYTGYQENLLHQRVVKH